MSIHNDDNDEHFQLFNEVVYVWQPWWSTTPNQNLPITNASTPIITSVGYQNQPSHTNIHLVLANLEMEQLHLFNKLEQLRHVNRRPSNQSIFITHVKLVELKATPTIVQHGVIYPKGT